MPEPIQILWTPAGQNLPDLGDIPYIDKSDGDTPNIRMPIRMLSVDTPEVTARSLNGAANVDAKFGQLAEWMRTGRAPVSARFRDYILPKLESGGPGTLQFNQGKSASGFFEDKIAERLTKPNSDKKRRLFVRVSEAPFDDNGRLLAYISPYYASGELKGLTRAQRSTFNLDLIESGWAAPFVIFPNIPGELDLPLFLKAAEEARDQGRGQHADPLSLPGYEYRMCEKLFRITKKLVEGQGLSYSQQLAWRSRYCADMRTRRLHGPEDYFGVPGPYRIWIWPQDVQQAIGLLNLIPVQG